MRPPPPPPHQFGVLDRFVDTEPISSPYESSSEFTWKDGCQTERAAVSPPPLPLPLTLTSHPLLPSLRFKFPTQLYGEEECIECERTSKLKEIAENEKEPENKWLRGGVKNGNIACRARVVKWEDEEARRGHQSSRPASILRSGATATRRFGVRRLSDPLICSHSPSPPQMFPYALPDVARTDHAACPIGNSSALIINPLGVPQLPVSQSSLRPQASSLNVIDNHAERENEELSLQYVPLQYRVYATLARPGRFRNGTGWKATSSKNSHNISATRTNEYGCDSTYSMLWSPRASLDTSDMPSMRQNEQCLYSS